MSKIAVATICLNEEKFIERWVGSAQEADHLILGDTGSTDGTVPAAEALGVVVHRMKVVPWRFDVARNTLLSLIPSDVDVVVTLDADEVLTPGWRDALDRVAGQGNRYTYNYVWSWTADGQPDIQFQADRCHARDGYLWRHPCHETLYPSAGQVERVVHAGFSIHHHPDDTKSRGGYLDLLKTAAKETPSDPRVTHYLAREYYLTGNWDAARAEFLRHLALPTARWAAERAESYRYLAKMDYNPERWLLHAIAEDQNRRDAMVDLIDLYLDRQMNTEAAGMAARALRVVNNPMDYMSRQHANDGEFLEKVKRQDPTVLR